MEATSALATAPVAGIEVRCCTIPTEEPESDGTLEWTSTTIVIVQAHAGGRTGTGYAYGHAAAAAIARDTLAELVVGRDALDVAGIHEALAAAVRNVGRGGVASTAISAIDTALWDLKARILDVPLSVMLDARRTAVPVYGSGGFTSASLDALSEQLGGWAEAGMGAVKMKVGRHPAADPERVAVARRAIGDDVTLMVDANGAHSPAEALDAAARFAELGVTWFEEPVSSDDLDGMRRVRAHAPAGVEVTAGEYGYDPWYFHRMVGGGSGGRAVDVAQPDATRCGGYTAFAEIAAVCRAAHTPISAHTAPQLHAHIGVAAPGVRHIEWFHDHVRIERLLFDGCLEPVDGQLRPDRTRPGHGLVLKERDAERYEI